MGISLIVNADDFGLTAGVNAGIVSCHDTGAVTSTTLMTNMEAAEEAAELARSRPSLSVGLHFNLTQGRPLSRPEDVPTLIDPDGCFLQRSRLIRRILRGRVIYEDVEVELRAQCRRMSELGMRPSHFDSHQHIHMFPVIFAVLAARAQSWGVPLRIPRRWAGWASNRSFGRRLREFFLERITDRCLSRCPTEIRTNDGFCSVFDLDRSARDLKEDCYAELLRPYDSGVIELMVHPAFSDSEVKRMTAISAVSEVESRLLLTGAIQRYIGGVGGRLVNYSEAFA